MSQKGGEDFFLCVCVCWHIKFEENNEAFMSPRTFFLNLKVFSIISLGQSLSSERNLILKVHPIPLQVVHFYLSSFCQSFSWFYTPVEKKIGLSFRLTSCLPLGSSHTFHTFSFAIKWDQGPFFGGWRVRSLKLCFCSHLFSPILCCCLVLVINSYTWELNLDLSVWSSKGCQCIKCLLQVTG